MGQINRRYAEIPLGCICEESLLNCKDVVGLLVCGVRLSRWLFLQHRSEVFCYFIESRYKQSTDLTVHCSSLELSSNGGHLLS